MVVHVGPMIVIDEGEAEWDRVTGDEDRERLTECEADDDSTVLISNGGGFGHMFESDGDSSGIITPSASEQDAQVTRFSAAYASDIKKLTKEYGGGVRVAWGAAAWWD